MISTSNYAARKYGVRAAMPGYLGKLLVDELSGGKESLTFVKSDYELYQRKSEEVRRVLQEYDPRLKMYSLDEAYMDIGPYLNVMLSLSGAEHESILRELLKEGNKAEEEETGVGRDVAPDVYHEAAQELLRSIRERVKDVTGLSCSAGLASNFLIAKGERFTHIDVIVVSLFISQHQSSPHITLKLLFVSYLFTSLLFYHSRSGKRHQQTQRTTLCGPHRTRNSGLSPSSPLS